MSRITRIPHTPSKHEHTREIRLDILDVNQAWCTVHKTTKPDTTSDAEFASIIATYTDLSEQLTHNGLKTRLLNLHGEKVELIKTFGCNEKTLIFNTPSPTSLGISYSLGAKVRLFTDENLSGKNHKSEQSSNSPSYLKPSPVTN
jgi:hypothetical protein